MRVVIDTNVFIATCFGSQAPGEVLAECIKGTLVPLMGSALLAEYESVLGRPDLFRSARLDARQREDLLDIFLASCQWVQIYFLWRPNLRDEADNHVLELAIAGGAHWIVTRNVRDFAAPMLRFPDLQIGPPEAVLKEIAS